MHADHAGPREPQWIREVLGLAVAVALAIATVAVVATSARSELLFRDGDSLVTSLVVGSMAAGQPQDWAMSSVLFLPEIVGVAVLQLFGLGVAGTLAVAAVLNLVALYGALRVAAGAWRRAGAGASIAGALLALLAFALLAMTEASPSRDALEPASLLLTTTYYSATVIGTVLAIGLARRGLDAPARWTPWVLGAVAAASVLTNPLFVAWATVPLAGVLGVVAGARRPVRAAAGLLAVALVAGSVVGFALRMPLAHLIANTGAGYADPSQWSASLAYYAQLVAERGSAPGGLFGIVLGVALWAWCAAASALLWRRARIGAALVAACGWVLPVIVVLGAVALGTHAARYLQPIAFAPVLGLVVLPALLPVRVPRVGVAAAAALGVGALVLAGALGIPRIAAAASAPDADLDCVVHWTDASARTGAGQFWTVRLPKAHLADPRRLVQVDHELRGYAWLVNRDDFAVGEVSFLVLDAQSAPFALPDGVTLDDAELIRCGRYTIADFDRPLPLGPQRS